VIDILVGGVHLSYRDLEWFFHVAFANTFDLRWHGSAEQPGGLTVRGILKDEFDIILETHVQHFISLIQHHIFDLFEIDRFAFDQVNQAAWCCHHDLHASFQFPDLLPDGCSAIHCGHIHLGQEFLETFQFGNDLEAQFSCRANYQRLGVSLFLFNKVQ